VKRLAARYYFLILLCSLPPLHWSKRLLLTSQKPQIARQEDPPVASVAQHLLAPSLFHRIQRGAQVIELALDNTKTQCMTSCHGASWEGAGLLFLASLPAKSVKSTGTIS